MRGVLTIAKGLTGVARPEGSSYRRGHLLVCAGLALLGACSSASLTALAPQSGEPRAAAPIVRPTLQRPEPTERPVEPEPAMGQRENAETTADRLVYFESNRASLGLDDRNRSRLEGRTLRLNFVDAPVSDVVRTVVGEALDQPVLVATGVEGRITLTSTRETSARAALIALETVLTESGYVLVERDAGFLLTQAQDARPNLTGLSSELGYGGRVIPVIHANPSDMLGLIDPFLSSQVDVVPQDDAGVLILVGPGPELQAVEDAVQTFDRPFLTDRVFGMFELRFVDATTAKTEVESVLTGLNGSTGGVRTIALPRLNYLFVATRDRGSFDQVQAWIERFDIPSGGVERRLRYYTARNAPASVLATQISAAFAGGVSGGGGNYEAPFADQASRDGAGGDEPEGRLAIIPDQLNNALIIRATDQEYREILDLLERMDVMPPQVLIEATIAEVRLIDGLDFGVRWFFENSGGDLNRVSFTNDTAGSVNPIFPGFNYAYTGSDLSATLSALSSITDVSVLSAPSIMVQNNQTANLQVGDEVPIVTQTASSVANPDAPLVSTVELRETGVILEVTPRINASGLVVLEVNQEVSTVRPTTTSGIDSPTIQKLQFTSTVAVRSESTVALGGLIRETVTDNASGVPGLSRLPVIGNAFNSREQSTDRSELVIFLRPYIITTDAEADEALSRLRRELEILESRQQDLFD